jgi:5-methylcytosine-specific restriction endonuclease McrA
MPTVKTLTCHGKQGCGEKKPVTAFCKCASSKTGYYYLCKECKNKLRKVWQKRRREQLDAVLCTKKITKQCSKEHGCGKIKPLDEFPVDIEGKYGRHSVCKECKRDKVKIWSANNLDKRRKNKANYRARKKKALDEKADQEKIKQFYKEAHTLSKLLGFQFQVDHVIPLSKGGKHHESNLRVVSRERNLEKNDRMPTEEELKLAGKLIFPELFGQADEEVV